MHIALSEVAEVLSGHHFRERLSHDAHGNVAVIQMKDVAESHIAPSPRFARVQLPPVPERIAIREGDVILRARGDSYTGVLARGAFERTVVAAPLTLIRADANVLLSGYLAWIINHPATQAQLAGLATGTYVRTVGKAALEALAIPVPPIERQKTIVQIAALEAAEQVLLHEIGARRKRLADGILWRYAQDAR